MWGGGVGIHYVSLCHVLKEVTSFCTHIRIIAGNSSKHGEGILKKMFYALPHLPSPRDPSNTQGDFLVSHGSADIFRYLSHTEAREQL